MSNVLPAPVGDTQMNSPTTRLQRKIMTYHEVVLKKLVASGYVRLALQFAGCSEPCRRLLVRWLCDLFPHDHLRCDARTGSRKQRRQSPANSR